MVHDIIGEAITAHRRLEDVLERKAVASSCDEHRHVQRFISSYIAADSMEEFPAIVHALKTGHAFVDDLRSEISRLGNITEEDHCRSFRYAMRHAYARDQAGTEHAAREALFHMERWQDKTLAAARFIGFFYGNSSKEIMQKMRKANDNLFDYLDATMYLLSDPVCAHRYIGGLCDTVRDTFDDLERPAAALAHIRELAYHYSDNGEPHEDFFRFSDRCFRKD